MYALVEILFEGNYEQVVIAVGTGFNEKYDDRIFFYVDSMDDLESLKEEGVEDFVVTRVIDLFEDADDIFWV